MLRSAVAALFLIATTAFAQYPSRPIVFTVGFAAGATRTSDPDWLAGNAKLAGIPSIRSPEETEKFMKEQFELYEKLAISLGIRE